MWLFIHRKGREANLLIGYAYAESRNQINFDHFYSTRERNSKTTLENETGH